MLNCEASFLEKRKMEEKYICPECGAEMKETYNKPSLLLDCPKCGCKIATTKWDPIDLDQTIYELFVEKIESPTLDNLRFISSMTGDNYIKTKQDLIEGNISFKYCAVDMKEKMKEFDNNNIKYHIAPEFHY